MMYMETYSRQLTKWGEELCGDNVEIVRTPQNITITLADGLGSGVKANILATLTTKIASSMLRDGVELDEVVATIAETLPVCRVRGLAYSTIAILQITPSGECYLAEFDTPESIVLCGNEITTLQRVPRTIAGRTIYESSFFMERQDTVLLMSDGVIHAGVGAALNMGWQWKNVAYYVHNLLRRQHSLRSIVSSLVNTCNHLYGGKPGDDTTVVGVRALEPQHVTILSGPPQSLDNDAGIVKEFLSRSGAKIICGGSTAQMVAREAGLPLKTELDCINSELPPVAEMPGIDLVTEGIITMTAAVSLIRNFAQGTDDFAESALLKRHDGASMLADLLLNRATHVNLMVGQAVNQAHLGQLPINIGLRHQLMIDLSTYLRQLGKEVSVEYF